LHNCKYSPSSSKKEKSSIPQQLSEALISKKDTIRKQLKTIHIHRIQSSLFQDMKRTVDGQYTMTGWNSTTTITQQQQQQQQQQ